MTLTAIVLFLAAFFVLGVLLEWRGRRREQREADAIRARARIAAEEHERAIARIWDGRQARRGHAPATLQHH